MDDNREDTDDSARADDADPKPTGIDATPAGSAQDADSERPGDGALTTRRLAEKSRLERQEQKRLRREARAERRESRPKLKKLRVGLVVAGVCGLAVVSWVFGILMAVAQDLPNLESRAQFDRAQNSVVTDRYGAELATLTGNQRRILLGSDEISQLLKEAVVAIEDERFYEHRGIDYLGIARALKEDILAGSAVQGGSTITQQFVKNALEAQSSRTVLQKLREAALAYQIERSWDKDKILTNYLNNIYFGEGAYGIEAAARTFFGAAHPGCGGVGERCADQLRVEEAAMLAGMISSPSAYSPRTNPEDAVERRNVVLTKMRELGKLSESDEEFEGLLSRSGPAISTINPPTEQSAAPYFTDWLRQQLVDRYGAGEAFGGGLRIESTLDLELQTAAQDVVSSRLSGLGPTAAVVVLDNATAEVRAMVGGQDFNKAPFNLATNGLRQPGSSFKPFTLVTALENGFSSSDVFASQPVEIPFTAEITNKQGEEVEVEDLFRVSNYDDNYLGSATIATATTNSDNSVYAQLGTQVGTGKIADMAQAMGIESPIDDNPAMILGGLENGVTPLEMAYAYTTLGNRGLKVSGTLASRGDGSGPVGIRKVKDDDGEFVSDDSGATGENKRTEERVIDETVANTSVDILRTVVTSGTGTNAATGSDTYQWGKTGTTDNNADAWFVGSNDVVTVAVWVGYPDGATPMLTEFGGLPVDGGTIPALIWNDVISAAEALQAEQDAEVAAEEAAEAAEDGTTVPPTTTAPLTPAPVAPVEEVPVVPEEPVEEAPVEVAPEPDPAPVPDDGGAGPTAAGRSGRN